jgi:hypothetical protein
MQGKRFSGRGNPPARLLWLQLPGCVAGQPPRKLWRWEKFSDDRWKLENSITGEILEGYFNP